MKRHWPLLMLLALGIAFVSRQSSLREHQAKRERLTGLLTSLASPPPLAISADQSPITTEVVDMQALRTNAFRVHQLRSEVTLARQRLDNLAPAVTDLAAKSHARTNQLEAKVVPEFPPGYRPRHELADRGNATPEAALETIWWAFTQGRAGRLNSLVLELAGRPSPPEDVVATDMREMFQRFPGFRIASQEVVEGNRLKVGIETGPGAKPHHFMLVATNNQWLVSMEQSDRF
jgi:hypothetical protein